MKSVPQDMFSSRIIAWTLLTLICSLPLRPQSTYTGKLSGEVTDPSGAVIAGAKVTLTDQAIPVQPTWKDLRAAFTLRTNERVAIGKMADSTRQRYEYTIKSFEEFLNSRSVTELKDIDRSLIEAYKAFRHGKIIEKKYSRKAAGLSLDVAILHGLFNIGVEKRNSD